LKKALHRILFISNLFIAAALLTAYLATIVSPARNVIPAFFGLAYPYLLLLNILMIIIWVMLLRFEAFISAVVIVIGINHFTNSIKLSNPKSDTSDSFQVISYNVHAFQMFNSDGDKSSENEIMNLLKEEDADIICLQEFFVIGNMAAKLRSINAALGKNYSSHLKTVRSRGNRAYGVIILSKYPIINRGEIVYAESSGFTIYADVLIDQDTFRIYNNHLQSFNLGNLETTLIEDVIRDEDAMVKLRNLYSTLKRGFVKRAHQAEELKEHINSSKYSVIVAGDFNDTPVSYA
jgi:endonuclease/exonuclease/phosphatase family metal-dependent hydrolase